MTTKRWKFPAGEIGVYVDPPQSNDSINFYLRNGSSDEILQLLMEVDAYSRRQTNQEFELYMPYVPYGRQDRVTEPGTSFSLQVFASLINRQVFKKVHVLDQHSHVTEELIHNTQNYAARELMPWFPIQLLPMPVKEMVVVAPDKGAVLRAGECASALGIDRVVYATKTRNPSTGRIENIQFVGDLNHTDHVLIIDDICDGGGTFLALNDAIGGKCKTISLFVTHGIFSRGYKAVADHFHAVITTDSFTPPMNAGYNMADRPPTSHIIKLNNIIPNWT
jgi:ribose-phosphate pyrophosphokinase